MNISSRTPEGLPSECPICGARTNIEYSDPGQDAPCPNCGHLLWASNQLLDSVTQYYSDVLGTSLNTITSATRIHEISGDSLDMIEMIMDLEERHDIQIPPEMAEEIQTVGDLVRIIQNQQP